MNIISLTIEDLHDIIRESVYRLYTKLPLYEYAIHRSEFIYKVSNLLPQIIENWCLIRYCTLVGRKNTKKHWKDELIAHMLNVGGLDIKGNNKSEKRLKAIYDGFKLRDLVNDCSDRIFLYIENKFEREKINLNDDIVKKVVNDCNNALCDIAKAIAEPMTIRDYVNTI